MLEELKFKVILHFLESWRLAWTTYLSHKKTKQYSKEKKQDFLFSMSFPSFDIVHWHFLIFTLLGIYYDPQIYAFIQSGENDYYLILSVHTPRAHDFSDTLPHFLVTALHKPFSPPNYCFLSMLLLGYFYHCVYTFSVFFPVCNLLNVNNKIFITDASLFP